MVADRSMKLAPLPARGTNCGSCRGEIKRFLLEEADAKTRIR